ncbi:hypothetical protein [Hymenobacter cheonanensis]|uniref:hypothetical protein n=1 Tax=Hymenobacter sp. CA2-7 TaxID=3063993 RepID=UPI00271267D3|nr:hypothetical protein [Hymenobacter sp. CA2-7]MDO7887895.1 hypothetical protein [Hymenobacter sp. CA2-7]
MRTLLLSLTLLGASQLLSGCQTTDTDLRPANYDELAMATGHWEWERSVLGFTYNKTPASVGYTRQLVFGPDHRLLLRRRGQADFATTYQLTTYAPPGGTKSLPALRFDTAEPALPTGSLRYYDLSQQNGQQLLTLVGERANLDADAIETYHWVAE